MKKALAHFVLSPIYLVTAIGFLFLALFLVPYGIVLWAQRTVDSDNVERK